MKRLHNLFRQPEFHWLWCCAGLILCNGPLIVLYPRYGPGTIFAAVFLLWALAIWVLRLIADSLAANDAANDNHRGR